MKDFNGNLVVGAKGMEVEEISQWTLARTFKDILFRFLLNFTPKFLLDDPKRSFLSQKNYISSLQVNSTMNEETISQPTSICSNMINGVVGAKRLISPSPQTFATEKCFSISGFGTQFQDLSLISIFQESLIVEESLSSRNFKMTLSQPDEIKVGEISPNLTESIDFQQVKSDQEESTKEKMVTKGRSASRRQKKRDKRNARRSRMCRTDTEIISNEEVKEVVENDVASNKNCEEKIKKRKHKRRRRRKKQKDKCDSINSENTENCEKNEKVIFENDVKCDEETLVDGINYIEWNVLNLDEENEDCDIVFVNTVATMGTAESLFIYSDEDWDEVSDVDSNNDNDLWESFQNCGLQSTNILNICVGHQVDVGSISTSPNFDEIDCFREYDYHSQFCDDRIANANRRWLNGLNNTDKSIQSPKKCGKDKKVHFAPDDKLRKTRHLITWSLAHQLARKGHWEMYARDRARFQNRIKQLEHILNPILTPAHREMMYQRQFIHGDKD